MNTTAINFKYVDYLWDEEEAARLGNDQVALFLYRSNILGALTFASPTTGAATPVVKPSSVIR